MISQLDSKAPQLTPNVFPAKSLVSRSTTLLGVAAVSLFIALSAYLTSFGVQARVERAELISTVQSSGQPKKVVKYPFREDLHDQTFSGVLELRVSASTFRAKRYAVSVDDCVDWLEVNDVRVKSPVFPYCNYKTPVNIEFGEQLRVGTNVVRFGYRNFGGVGELRFKAAPDEPFVTYIWSLEIVCLTTFFLCLAAFLVRHVGLGAWIAMPFLLGTALRILYFMATPIDVREHDFGGHVEYIEKIANGFGIPQSNDGWQGYQPPLYYAISAFVYRGSMLLGADSQAALHSVRLLSVAMSIGMLYLSIVFIARLPFKRYGSLGALLAASVVAALPSLVMASTRINNDTLAQPLVLVAFALLYTWWTTGAVRSWYGSVLVLCLALLTKANALALVPLYAFCLLFAKGVRLREKFVLVFGALVIFYVLVGWYVVFRLYSDGQHQLVGNASHLDSALKVDTSLPTLTIFNPLEVLKYPYNNPWSDGARRAHLWEYVIRGALFGEFNFGPKFLPYAQFLLGLFMLLCMFAVAGCYSGLSVATLPIGLFFVSQLAGLAAFRTQFPYSCSQDVRYILVASIPLAFYIAQGCVAFSKKWLAVGTALFAPFIALSSYFVYFLLTN